MQSPDSRRPKPKHGSDEQGIGIAVGLVCFFAGLYLLFNGHEGVAMSFGATSSGLFFLSLDFYKWEHIYHRWVIAEIKWGYCLPLCGALYFLFF